ncbi:haloacid dehalogenase-like hydrolase [Burkholderia pseudomallei 1710b]|nr:haloacid dehalogenase-like hydrolase [Burkholderia pseudomallei 1710b]
MPAIHRSTLRLARHRVTSMARQQFDLIVFDWDGTLMDSTAHIAQCIQAACRDLGVPAPSDEAARYVIGLGLRDALAVTAPSVDPADYPRLAERYRFHYLVKDQRTELFGGVREMLEELRDTGYLLAVATGKGRVGLNRALDQAKLTSLFDATRCADETFSKPHPAMLQELSRELGQDLARTVMIGDTTHDLQMAASAGAAGVGVAYGAHSADALAALSPRFVAADVAALAGWLREHA